MAQQKAHETICQHLQITKAGPLNLVEWKTNLADRWDGLTEVRRHSALIDAHGLTRCHECLLEASCTIFKSSELQVVNVTATPTSSLQCLQVLRIAMVGKYTGLSDAYLSVIKALQVLTLLSLRITLSVL